MLSSIITKLKKQRRIRFSIPFVVLLVITIVLLIPPLNFVEGYTIIIDNSVDADSDIDSTENKGTDGTTDYTDAQIIDGSDQIIVESNEGGGGGGGGATEITVYHNTSSSGQNVQWLNWTINSDGDFGLVMISFVNDNLESVTVYIDDVQMTNFATIEDADDSHVSIYYLNSTNSGTGLTVGAYFNPTLVTSVAGYAAILNGVDGDNAFGTYQSFSGDPPTNPVLLELVTESWTDSYMFSVVCGEYITDPYYWYASSPAGNLFYDTIDGGHAMANGTGVSDTYTFSWNVQSGYTGTPHTAALAVAMRAGGVSDDVSKYPASVTNAYDPSDIGVYSDWTKMQAVDSDENNLTEAQLGSGGGYPVLESWSTTEGLANPSVTVTKPSGTVEDDLLIMIVTIDGAGAPISITAGGTSWNVMLAEVQTSGHTTATFYKIAGGSEPSSYTGTWSGNEDSVGGVLRFTNFDSADPFDDSATNTGSSTPITFPAITTTTDNTFILRMAGMDDDEDLEPITGVPSPHTELWALATTSSSGECTQLSMNTSKGTAGTVVSADWSHDSSEDWYSLSIAINGAEGEGSGDYLFDREFRFTGVSSANFTNVELDIKTGTITNETLMIHIYDSGSWVFVANLTDSNDDTWINTSVIDYFATTMYFRFNSSIYDDTDTYLNHWEIDAVVLHYYNSSILYQLEWEHQVQSADPHKDFYLLTIYGYSSSATESFEIQMWNGASWDTALSTTIDNTEQWYNQSISASYVDGSNYITYRFRGTVETSDTTQDTLYLDYSGVRAYNFSIYGLPSNHNGLSFSLDAEYHALDDSPLLFVVETGKTYNVQITGVDGTGSPVSGGYLYWNTVDNTGTSTLLTTSWVNFLTSQPIGNNSHYVYLWVNYGWSVGDPQINDIIPTYTLNITISGI